MKRLVLFSADTARKNS